MCLITDNKKQIATEDIIVFKLVHNSLQSQFEYFQYELNTLYETEIKESTSDIGFYCSIDSNDTQNYIHKKYNFFFNTYIDLFKFLSKNRNFKVLKEGFHSISNDSHLFIRLLQNWGDSDRLIDYYVNRLMVKCKIPAGSEYYTDVSGFLVSNKIILEKTMLLDEFITEYVLDFKETTSWQFLLNEIEKLKKD